MLYIKIVLLVVTLSFPVFTYSQENGGINENRNSPFEDAQTRAIVDTLFARMTLDEKIAQLCGIRPHLMLGDDGKLSLEKCRKIIPNGIGHLCQFAFSMKKGGIDMNGDELRTFIAGLQHFLRTETPSKIPAIFHEEAITGFCALGATTYPQHIGVACSWNPELVEKKSEYTAQTMRSVGSTMALSPMLDVCKTAYFERVEEGFGEDPYLTGRMGLAFVNGLQHGGLKHGVAATAKHFAGYGGGIDDAKEFFEETLFPFEAVIRLGGVKSVMPGYHSYKGEKCIGNKELLTGILRGTLDFDGVTVSDYGAISRLKPDGAEGAAKAMNAGADLEFPHPGRYLMLKEALAEGSVSEEQFEAAVKRALTLKARMGLLDNRPDPDVSREALDLDPPAHRQMAYSLAAQTVVLLKNDNILPLSKQVGKIALMGPNADAVQSLLGDYTYQSMTAFFVAQAETRKVLETPHLVTLREGLQNRAPAGMSVLYERGCDWNRRPDIKVDANGGDAAVKDVKVRDAGNQPVPDLENALRIAGESDVVILAMGEYLWLTGEGRNRGAIRLPDEQEEFIRKMIATGKPLILVMFGGRPQMIAEFEPHCAAILQAWYPGEEGGNAVADILLGNVNPSAKLCMTYPKNEAKTPVCYNYGYNGTDNCYLYPFGYGLSYTSYTYGSLNLPAKASVKDEWIDISFTVENTGTRAGAEVAQLYVAPKGLSVPGKPLQLKGFQRMELKAGEKRRITVRLSPKQLAYYSEGKWIVEPGKYEIMAGASSTDIRLRKEFVLEGEKIEMNRRTVFFSEVIF
jgi:beta-glucosidase